MVDHTFTMASVEGAPRGPKSRKGGPADAAGDGRVTGSRNLLAESALVERCGATNVSLRIF